MHWENDGEAGYGVTVKPLLSSWRRTVAKGSYSEIGDSLSCPTMPGVVD